MSPCVCVCVCSVGRVSLHLTRELITRSVPASCGRRGGPLRTCVAPFGRRPPASSLHTSPPPSASPSGRRARGWSARFKSVHTATRNAQVQTRGHPTRLRAQSLCGSLKTVSLLGRATFECYFILKCIHMLYHTIDNRVELHRIRLNCITGMCIQQPNKARTHDYVSSYRILDASAAISHEA